MGHRPAARRAVQGRRAPQPRRRTTVEGIEKYLGSGLVKGIGPKYARKIVEVFGERTLQVIDESPSFLKEVKGIGPQRISRIRESWREQKAVRDIMVFLQSHGLGTARAVRIYKTYGDQAVEHRREQPLPAGHRHLGRRLQDGRRTGPAARHRPAPRRCGPGGAALRAARAQPAKGHVGYPEEGVVAETAGSETCLRMLSARRSRPAVRKTNWSASRRAATGGTEDWLYLKPLFLAELGVARSIHKLQDGEHPLPTIDVDTALRRVEEKMNLQLASNQREALQQQRATRCWW